MRRTPPSASTRFGRRARRRGAAVGLAAATLVLLPACGFKGQPTGPQRIEPDGQAGAPPDAPADAWTPRPVAMRIYPATRFIRDQGQPMLSVTVELFDAMGDSVKASGHYRIELSSAGDARGSGAVPVGQQLYQWNIPVVELEDHRSYYDPITRGYLFRLSLRDLSAAARNTLLQVSFQPVRGDRIEADTLLPGAGP